MAAAVGAVQLDVGVGHRTLRVAAVAHPGEHLPGSHPDPGSDAGGEPPRAVVGAVVGARRVVVDVVEVVLPPVVVTDHDAEAGRRVVEHPVDDAVVHRQQRLQAVSDQVVALVRPGAAVAAGAPVVEVGHRPGHGERDRPGHAARRRRRPGARRARRGPRPAAGRGRSRGPRVAAAARSWSSRRWDRRRSSWWRSGRSGSWWSWRPGRRSSSWSPDRRWSSWRPDRPSSWSSRWPGPSSARRRQAPWSTSGPRRSALAGRGLGVGAVVGGDVTDATGSTAAAGAASTQRAVRRRSRRRRSRSAARARPRPHPRPRPGQPSAIAASARIRLTARPCRGR